MKQARKRRDLLVGSSFCLRKHEVLLIRTSDQGFESLACTDASNYLCVYYSLHPSTSYLGSRP